MIYREAGVKKAGPGGGCSPCYRHPGVGAPGPDSRGFYTGRKLRARRPGPSAGRGIHHSGRACPARNQRLRMLYMLGIYETVIGNQFSNMPSPDTAGSRRAGRHFPDHKGAGAADVPSSPAHLSDYPGIHVRFPVRTFSGIPAGADLAASLASWGCRFRALYVMSMKEQKA